MWMACHTQEEIAAACDCSVQPVKQVISDYSANLPKNLQALASHAVDFDPPLYNIWKQQVQTAGSKHFGNSEVRWVDNLLYLYTQPFDVVVDPFAGGGSTTWRPAFLYLGHSMKPSNPIAAPATISAAMPVAQRGRGACVIWASSTARPARRRW